METSKCGDGVLLSFLEPLSGEFQRFAAHLFFVEGLTLAEIAEVQSIPEGTAKSRLFHARRKLKAALTEEQEGEE